MPDPSAGIAFVAGLVSFLSPCVLPLVPGYLSYMSGFSAEENTRTVPAWIVAVTFVLGFTAIFVALGATATLLGSTLRNNQRELAIVGGIFIILMGLVFIGVIKLPFLYQERRFHPSPKAGIWGSVLLGATFALGWTPCIGPTMGVALTMAAGRGAQGGAGEGAFLLAMYSLGLGIPFIVAGLGVSRLTSAMGWLRRHIRTVNVVSGVLLVLVGILFVTNELTELSRWMQKSMTNAGLDFWSEF